MELTCNDLIALEDDYGFVNPGSNGFVIYQVTNRLNGKRYIGFTSRSMEERWSEHLYDAKRGRRCYLHQAIRKHGPGVFHLEILETGINRLYGLGIVETFWICSENPEYNLSLGGEGGRKWKPTKQKRQRKGVKHTPEHVTKRKHSLLLTIKRKHQERIDNNHTRSWELRKKQRTAE